MLEELKERMVRIETKVDMVLTQQIEDGKASARTETDVLWLKGGMSIVLTIILGCAGWLAMQFFSTH